MPSPAIATIAALALAGPRSTSAFASGRTCGAHFVDAELAAPRFRRDAIVAGEHHDLEAFATQLIDGFARGRLDRIGDAEHAGRLAVDRDGRPRFVHPARGWRRVRRTQPESRYRSRPDDRPRRPLTPRPGIGSKSSRFSQAAVPRSAAPATMAAAKGCSLSRSTLAASRRTSESLVSGYQLAVCLRSASRSCRPPACRPFSSVSSASASRISTPAVAPRPVPTMIDMGVASPSAHGHAMISTATALISA